MKNITPSTKTNEVSRTKSSGIVNIHGKEYMTVARRIELAHDEKALESIETEVLSHNPVVIKAKVLLRGKIYTGISSVNLESSRQIEKQNPYEVAETSAVGRALGFAGFGLLESVASADEVIQSSSASSNDQRQAGDSQTAICEVCGQPATERKGITKTGKQYHGIFCSTGDKSHTRWLWN